MKTLLLVWLGLMPLWTNGQTVGLTPIDSLNKHQMIIERRLNDVFASLQRLSKTNDSLNKELYYYRAKDDFYVMAVDRQGSHFEWTLATVVAVAGFLSYTYFRRQLGRLKYQVDAQLLKYGKEIEILKYDITDAKVKLFSTVSTLFYRNAIEKTQSNDIEQLTVALNYSISSIVYANRSNVLASGEEEIITESKLKSHIVYAVKILEKIDEILKLQPNLIEGKETVRIGIRTIRVRLSEIITNKNINLAAQGILLKHRLDNMLDESLD